MGHATAKQWAKGKVIGDIRKINEELKKLDAGQVRVLSLPVIEERVGELERMVENKRLPAPIRKKIQTAIKKNQEVVTALKEWEI